MEKLKELNEIKHQLIEAVKSEMAKGVNSANGKEISAAVDMIKDIASAEKDCMEACYYELVSEAMDEGESERMGYDRWRYSNGRFAPKGRGKRGYTPVYMNEDRYGYENMPEMRYDRSVNRPGYTPNERMGNTDRLDQTFDTMGEIWSESDHETKVKMKKLVHELLDQMEQSGI